MKLIKIGSRNKAGKKNRDECTYWPDSFRRINKNVKNSANQRDINEITKEIIERLRENKNTFDYTIRFWGDAAVFGFKTDEGIYIYVAKDYWEACI